MVIKLGPFHVLTLSLFVDSHLAVTLLNCLFIALLVAWSSCRLAAFAAQRGEGKMPSPSFTLDAQLRFHDKWLKIDLQVCTREGGSGTKLYLSWWVLFFGCFFFLPPVIWSVKSLVKSSPQSLDLSSDWGEEMIGNVSSCFLSLPQLWHQFSRLTGKTLPHVSVSYSLWSPSFFFVF